MLVISTIVCTQNVPVLLVHVFARQDEAIEDFLRKNGIVLQEDAEQKD